LKQIGLEQYADAVLSGGYVDLGTLSQLDDISLDAMGIIKMDHRKKMLAQAGATAAQLANEAQQARAYAEQYYKYYGTQVDTNNPSQPQYMFTNAEYSGTEAQTASSLVSGYDDLQ